MSLLVVLTDCPRNHMPGGAFDRAAHKDVRQLMERYGCSDDEYKNRCRGIEDIEELEECLEECGS
ncbi:hypothetical protein [Myxococcus sp. RHSTA-1-4]|uniref:hypothetical protein n=1 Tax=Myxococcus sp. RHSTA-1-4 TaxID=2874601 RepID=UPI001CBD6225|nr:hypothetical protein [Myxococcus sp. RHSTA-1-4]MBZ4417600.1 hypothetical protein [Myxococcus sp. RHSTA-1-4]